MEKYSIAILWKERLSVLMFSEFFRKTYLRGKKVDLVSLSIYEGEESIRSNLLLPLASPAHLVILVKEPKVRNMENTALKALCELCEYVVAVDPMDPSQVATLKCREGQEAFLQEVLMQWTRDVTSLAG